MKTKLNRGIFTAILLAVLTGVAPLAYGQAIFAHNDYVKPTPFYRAFELKAEYIEADIFLEDGALLVAHTKKEIDKSKTLESMYLKPLSERVKDIYGLHLMIDLKTEGTPTLNALVKVLQKFPGLIACEKLFVVVSGSYPPPSEWKNYPSYIWFDGRPNVEYTKDQIDRLKLVSTSFPGNNAAKMKEVIDFSHSLNKPVRFWASPDNQQAWNEFIKAGVDILNTDKPEELAAFLKR
jgi:alkaline phosphatase